MERQITFDGGQSGTVSLESPLLRCDKNPILTPAQVNAVWKDPQLKVVTVFNSGVARLEGETVLLFRSHLRCGISVIGLARSKDGVTGWQIEPRPVMKPATPYDNFAPHVDPAEIVRLESGGVEDPRINRVGDTFAITYSAYNAAAKGQVRVSLATTKDFKEFTRYGQVLQQDMRNVVIFPEKINGKYVALFRPNDTTPGDVGGNFAQIRIGYTDDYLTGPWQIADQPIMKTGTGVSAFSDKIGPGAPPIKTEHGWLNIFHGVRTTMDGNPYVLGAALHDLNDPTCVKMASIPILFPSKADCRVAETDYVHVPNVVFSCGVISKEGDGTLLIYYGGNDTVMNVAATHVDVLAQLCQDYGQDPLTGRLLYGL